jgi:cell division protein FtsQ
MKDKNGLQIWHKNVLLAAVVVGIMALLYLSVQRKSNAQIDKVIINIKSLKDNQYLVNENDIKLKFKNFLGYDVINLNVKELNLRELEDLLNEDQRIKRAEIFIDSRDRLQVWVLQKQPIVRITTDQANQYYLDEDGMKIPVKYGPSIRVPLAGGSIEDYDFALLKKEEPSHLKDIYDLSVYIEKDEFLSSLIEQIYIAGDGHITMIPKVGRGKLSLGDLTDLEDKIENLKIFYKGGLPNLGWSDYSLLKLDYKGVVFKEKL